MQGVLLFLSRLDMKQACGIIQQMHLQSSIANSHLIVGTPENTVVQNSQLKKYLT